MGSSNMETRKTKTETVSPISTIESKLIELSKD
jgi:hypothetical protein